MTRFFAIAAVTASAVSAFSSGKLSAADDPQKDIVETAVAAEFKTLVTAVRTAGLVETLKGKGPFTVFAPTDKAFAAIPKEKLEALLKDKKALTEVLTYHVVAGKVMAADVVKLDAAKTVQGQQLKIESKDGKVKINNANVVKADIACKNGVIHVIDAVLLPPNPRAAAAQLIDDALGRAKGPADAAHAATLRDVAAEVLRLTPNNSLVRRILHGAEADRADVQGEKSAADIHSALHRAAEILRFEPTVEAEAPAGFPQPTPLGEIEIKSYPAYRLARAQVAESSEDSTFFTLFRHITSNEIAMTAPVEMTYGDNRDERSGPLDMAFLYESPQVGRLGKQGEVRVADVPAMTVVSLGTRGDYSSEKAAEGKRLLTQWLKHQADRYEIAGPMRMMGHNSPMVPVAQRFFEIQIPIREKSAAE
jgi:uncharacterized surface protein with fasciclin (FAS1) repeats